MTREIYDKIMRELPYEVLKKIKPYAHFMEEKENEQYFLIGKYSEEKECNQLVLLRKTGECHSSDKEPIPVTEGVANWDFKNGAAVFNSFGDFMEQISEAIEEVNLYQKYDMDYGEDTPFLKEFLQGTCPKHEITGAKGEKESRMTPHEIVEYLNKYIIGQDNAKKALAVAVYNHSKRLSDKTGLIRKSNVLIVGPTGTGKTLLAQTMADILDVPFAIADATSFTEAGYVGDDVENCLTRLLQAADNDVERAEKGIIYIDEIDKIARKSENPSITRDVSGEGVQQSLLKIIEGAEVSIPANGGRKHPLAANITINTKNILFICGGAFEGMLSNNHNNSTRGIGFNADLQKEEIERGLSTTLLTRFGMLPELIGRLPVLIQLDDIKKEDLVRILMEPKNALVKEYQLLLEADGVSLEFTPDALDEIAKMAMERKTGARGLRGIMEELMLNIMYDVPSVPEVSKCIITKESINTGKPVLIKKAA